MTSPKWTCPTCGPLTYATLMSGRGGLRSCPACGGIADPLPPSPVLKSEPLTEDVFAYWFRCTLADGRTLTMSVPKN